MRQQIYTEYNEKSTARTSNNKYVRWLANVFTYNNGTRKRIWELDVLRGILMIFVTLDHCCTFGLSFGIFDFQTEFGIWLHNLIVMYTGSAFRVGIQPFGLFLFCYLSGINCSFAKSKFKRVFKMLCICTLFMGGYALLHLIVPSFITSFLIFNIIAVITICVTFWWFLDLIKCPTWVRMGLSIAIICIGLTYYYMFFIRGHSYINNDIMALLVYNTHGYELSRNNFEPLFPHLGWFLLGGIMGKFIYKNKKTLTLHEEPYKPFIPIAYVGKHSLVVYIVGTVLVLAVIWGIKAIVGLFI